MKRFIGLFAATTALILPLSASGAGAAPAPAEYMPACDQIYEAGKPGWDQLIANAKDGMIAVEKAFCGENKYAK